MALTVTVNHAFVSGVADDPAALAAGEVCPQAHWNAAHNVVVSGSTTAQTFYISAVGNDANNGTSPATPWATISKVNAQVPTPDTAFLFRGGDSFVGTLVVAGSGQPGHPITYGSYDQGNATIAPSGNTNGFTVGEFDNLVFQNLNITGSGIGTNTNSGIAIATVLDHANYTFDNLTISNFGYFSIVAQAGDVTGATTPISRNWTFRNCTFSSIGDNAVFLQPLNITTTTVPAFVSFTNVLMQNCVSHDITGQNLSPIAAQNGQTIVCQGVDGFTVQDCLFHDNAYLQTAGGAAIYCASARNVMIQRNEVYNHAGVGKDSDGIQVDFGTTNCILQFNYLHDIGGPGINMGCDVEVGNTPNTNDINGMIIRYNLIVGCGRTPPFVNAPGISLYTLHAGARILNLVIHNNTIVAGNGQIRTNTLGLITDQAAGHAGPISAIIANNLLISDAKGPVIQYHRNEMRFINNIYFGGNTAGATGVIAGAIQYQSTDYANVTAWLAATVSNVTNQEMLDGAQLRTAAVLTADPLLLGGTASLATRPVYPLQHNVNDSQAHYQWTVGNPISSVATNFPGNPISSGMNPGYGSEYQLSAMSPVSTMGIDLSSLLPIQFNVPWFDYLGAAPTVGLVLDFDFMGASYTGDVIGSILCTRAGTTSTDLLYTDPISRGVSGQYNTFGANALRISSGRGLLIEEARTQILVNPTAPATQDVTLSTGITYVLWVNGPGRATISAGTGTIGGGVNQVVVATHNNPITFSMTVNGTVHVTVTGSLNAFQLEDTNGSGQPSSLITAAGARGADAVTATSASTIGQALLGTLNGQFGSNGNGVGTLIFFKPPTIPGNNVILNDASNLSVINIAGISAINDQASCTVNYKIGATTVTPANVTFPNASNCIGVNATTTSMALTLNAGTVVTGTPAHPSVTSPVTIGNSAAGGNALMGYIQRIIVTGYGGTSFFTAAQLQLYGSMTPTIPAGGIPHDFYNNPVPLNAKFGIGCHQSRTVGNTVVLNGAAAVTVADTNITANSNVFFTLNTVGGTVGAVPSIKTITPNVGFTVAGTASDTSTYNYVILP